MKLRADSVYVDGPLSELCSLLPMQDFRPITHFCRRIESCLFITMTFQKLFKGVIRTNTDLKFAKKFLQFHSLEGELLTSSFFCQDLSFLLL